MAILALDYGTKRIGVAISDETKTFAWAKTTILNKNFESVLSQLQEIINQENIELLIIGTPKGIELKPSKIVKEIEEFVEKLKVHISIPILLWDETLTTRMAIETFQKNGAKLRDKDSEAARIILQEYLDFYAEKSKLK
ncbi:MAG: putative pre-16S rRNA nuclease [Candidatus Dojkabacteria bacterium]|nr:MAG: putative pre-16S rRNA nuclease [Candidatus Dojkabacteria bacterium]GIW58892.1 MAG: putative pre-16S rRNA nuclease [Candidatus Dojkabacteria bacterium]